MIKKICYILCLFVAPIHAEVYLDPPENFHAKVEVSACFLECGDKILLLHRQDNKSQGQLWGIPGGKIDKGETPLQAVIREVFEETGFDISKQNVIQLQTVFIKYPNNFDYVYHMFKCKPINAPEAVKINFNEHKGFTWLTPSQALEMPLMLDEDICINLVYECFCQH